MGVVGTGQARSDAFDKVTGRALYTDDYSMAGQLYAVLVRSPYPHALIESITVPPLGPDCFVFTASDLKNNYIPCIFNDQPVFASDKVRHHGEPVAVAAAPTLEGARALAESVQVVYRPLGIVDDMLHALDDDAPKLFEKGNLCTEFHSLKGDPEAEFGNCALILEHSYDMPVQAHGFLEPEAAFSYIGDDGRLVLISSTQNAFGDRFTVCNALGLDPDSVVSMAATVGGAFGGKDGNTTQIYAAIVTHFTRRPARCVFTRQENIRWGMKRHAARVDAKAGFSSDGHLIAFSGHIRFDTGAYAMLGPSVLRLGMEHMCGPYFVPNVRLDGELVYTNHAPASAMRGFGAPQGAIAIESFMNEAAGKLGLSVLEIRKINAIHTGSAGSMGGVFEHSIGFAQALAAFEKTAFWDEMKNRPLKGVGYGVAAGMMSSGLGKHVPDSCHVSIDRQSDGSFVVSTSLIDMGQGSATALAQIAADCLGVGFGQIRMRMGCSEGTGDSGSTAASRSTFVCGNAIALAAKKILGGENHAEARFDFPEAGGEAVHTMFAFIVQGVKLSVDRADGSVRLLDMVSVTDTGRVINPTLLDGQVFGGVVMSCGYTLSESIRYRDGKSRETDFGNYTIPTSLDAPALENHIVEVPEACGPFGARGMAECPTVAVAPAIVTAVRSLCPDADISSLPIDRYQLMEKKHGVCSSHT